MSLPMTSWLCTFRRSSLPLLAALTLTTALTLAPAVPASAHSKLSASTPADGARLPVTPPALRFTFDQTLQPVPAWDAVLITGPDGTRHPGHSVRIAGDTLYAGCDRLGAAGVYRISYRVVSGDGHPIAGHITVALEQADPGSASAAGAVLSTVGLPAWFWIVSLALTLLLAYGYRRWRSGLTPEPASIGASAAVDQ